MALVRIAASCLVAGFVFGNISARCATPPAAVEAAEGMVTSVHALATEAGIEILRKGGNAIDAAVATGFALAVVHPFAGSLGSGGFMLIHLADGRDVAVDYRETAPGAAARDMYLDSDGAPIKGAGSSTAGWRASGIPGTVAGFALVLKKYGSGKVSWADVIEPARRLAADGHRVTDYTATSFRLKEKFLGQFAETKRIYLNAGQLWKPGDLWRQPELAATLSRLQQSGPREFYEGETAKRIVSAMQANAGTLSFEDLKHYQPVERVPLRGAYRGYEIVAMPPPSSGSIALLQMFAMLEPFDVSALGAGSAAKIHLFAEVMRRAFRDRAEFFGDPDVVHVPVAGLLDRSYLAERMKTFDPYRATPSAGLAAVQPAGWKAPEATGSKSHREANETTHYSIVDAAGNAVANTYTLNGAYGSGVTIPDTGILMNNQMDDFTSKPGVPNAYGLIQGEANAIAPGKRPLSSMTPTFVFKNRELFLVTGTRGGPTIINTVLQVITNVIDHGMNAAEAVAAPRINHQWMPDVITYEPDGLAPDVIDELRARGHAVVLRNLYDEQKLNPPRSEYFQGDAETIMIDPKTHQRLGAADPRQPDAKAIGY